MSGGDFRRGRLLHASIVQRQRLAAVCRLFLLRRCDGLVITPEHLLGDFREHRLRKVSADIHELQHDATARDAHDALVHRLLPGDRDLHPQLAGDIRIESLEILDREIGDRHEAAAGHALNIGATGFLETRNQRGRRGVLRQQHQRDAGDDAACGEIGQHQRLHVLELRDDFFGQARAHRIVHRAEHDPAELGVLLHP